MSYRRAAIFDPAFQQRIATAPLVLADIGARGDLGRPWRDLAALPNPALHLVGFEPDATSQDLVGASARVRTTTLKQALWSAPGEIELSLSGAHSSVHPPNLEGARQFEQRHMAPRQPQRTLCLPATTLDLALAEQGLAADAIKCDTQGSEYEILQGARRQLADHVFMVIAETWTFEVHRGQRLSHEVEGLMRDAGFAVMERQLHGRWGWQTDLGLMRRRQETSFDILFFATIDQVIARRPATTTLLKAAGLADLFGYPGYALDLLAAAQDLPGVEAAALDWLAGRIRQRRRAGAGTRLADAVALTLRRAARWQEARRWPPLGG